MLKKIKVIKGVGRFYDCSIPGDATYEFAQNTIFHAMNGYGKSTIVAILKSLSENEPSHILRKKTIGKTIPLQIVIALTDGKTMTFENDKWGQPSTGKPVIEVFDSPFIHENLFVQDVTIDHKKRIHSIVIGEEGKKLAEALETTIQTEKTAKKGFETKDKELQTRIEQTGRDDYLNVKDEEKLGIEAKIAELETQIKARKSEDEIDKLQEIKEIPPLTTPDFDGIKKILQTTHRVIHKGARELVEQHFERCCSDSQRAPAFIQNGLSLKKDDVCPFCGQNISSAHQLLDAYASYFDDTHKQVLQDIQQAYTNWKKWKFDTKLDQCLREKGKAQLDLEKWKNFMGDKLCEFSEDGFQHDPIWRDTVAGIITAINDMFERKIADLQYSADTTQIDELKTIGDKIKNTIQTSNDDIKRQNQAIVDFREKLKKGGTLGELRKSKQKFTELLKRFDEDEKEWCSEYARIKIDYEKAQTAHATAKTAMDTYSQTIFTDFQMEINSVLNELGTTFHLDELAGTSNKQSTEPFSEFVVVVNGTESPLQTSRLEPSFKSILSEGDKNALAFAFFVAKLKKKENLNNTILIFDDPVSSMDLHRRRQTVRILKDLSAQTRQCLIFSHYEDFLYLVWDTFFDSRAFRIRSDENTGSRFELFDIVQERRLEQHKRIDLLVKYCNEDNGVSPQEMQSKIRLCIETSIKFKYFRHFTNETTLGSILDTLQNKKVLLDDVMKTCRELNSDSAVAHHGEYETQPLQELTRDEVIFDIKRLLDVLEKI